MFVIPSDIFPIPADARRCGFDGIDLQTFVNTDTPLFAAEDTAFDTAVREEGMRIRDAGLTVFQTHGPWRWPPRDGTEAERTIRFAQMARALRGTRLVGARYMALHPLMPFSIEEQPDEGAFFGINYDYYRRLAHVAEEEGVIICLENMPMPRFPLARTGAILDFVRDIASPALRVCLDTGHALVCGESLADAVRTIGPEFLRILHVHDNDGTADQHRDPGDGIGDWPAFAAALHETGCTAPINLEVHALPSDLSPEETVARGMRLAEIARGMAE